MKDAEACDGIDVTLSRELLREIDAYAVHHGYENPSAVVSEAIDRKHRSRTDNCF